MDHKETEKQKQNFWYAILSLWLLLETPENKIISLFQSINNYTKKMARSKILDMHFCLFGCLEVNGTC